MILSEGEQINFDSVIEKNKKQKVFLKLKLYRADNSLQDSFNMCIHSCQQSVRLGYSGNGKYTISSIVKKLTDPIQIQFYNEIVVPLLESNLVKSYHTIGKTGIMRVILYDKPEYYNLKMFLVVNVIRNLGRVSVKKLAKILEENKELAEADPELSLVSRYQLLALKNYGFLNSRDVAYWPRLVKQTDVDTAYNWKHEYLYHALNWFNNNKYYTNQLTAINKMNGQELINLVKQNQ